MDSPRPTSRIPTLAARPGPLVFAFLWGLVLAAAVVLPFILAGKTSNAIWIAVPVFLTLVYVVVREASRCLAYYRSLWPWAWAPALGLAAAALAVTIGLAALLGLAPSDSPLNWSLGSLFNVGGDAGMNGFAIPFTNPLLAIVYAPAAVLALPLLAWWEEDIFRRGTRGWRSAIIRSVLFGLLHLTAGVGLGTCVALGCAGFVFTIGYWRALRDPAAESRRAALPDWVRARLLPLSGSRRAREDYAVFRATQAHLVYNAVLICAVLLSLFGPFRSP